MPSGIGGIGDFHAAAVLGDQHIDPVIPEQR
jgi:hypothetical protein